MTDSFELLEPAEREAHDLVRHADALDLTARQLTVQINLLAGSVRNARAVDGPDVWSGARARAVRERLDELVDRVDGGHDRSVRSLLAEHVRTMTEAAADARSRSLALRSGAHHHSGG